MEGERSHSATARVEMFALTLASPTKKTSMTKSRTSSTSRSSVRATVRLTLSKMTMGVAIWTKAETTGKGRTRKMNEWRRAKTRTLSKARTRSSAKVSRTKINW